jgi:hypothetical protein
MTDKQIVDEDNQSHKARQQTLQRTRDELIETRKDAHMEMIAGSLTKPQARQIYRSAVDSLLIQLNPILERHETDEDYLTGVALGSITFEPPDELVEYARDNIIRLPDGVTVPTTETVTITGLKQLHELPVTLGRSWTVATVKGTRHEERSRTVQTTVPFDVLDEATQQADNAMHDLGLGFEIDDDDEWEI